MSDPMTLKFAREILEDPFSGWDDGVVEEAAAFVLARLDAAEAVIEDVYDESGARGVYRELCRKQDGRS